MSKKQITPIFYYVPQDKDDPDTLNLFTINAKKDQLKLKHVYQNFPLKGSYIFRFKIMYENNIGWLDLPNMEAKLPLFKDKVIVKANRINWKEQLQNGIYSNNKTQATSKNSTKNINLMEDHINNMNSTAHKHGDLI